MLVGYFGPQGERGREDSAQIANFISTFSIVVESVGVGGGDAFGCDASNGPVNILTAVLFAAAAEDGRAANAHFGPLNDS